LHGAGQPNIEVETDMGAIRGIKVVQTMIDHLSWLDWSEE